MHLLPYAWGPQLRPKGEGLREVERRRWTQSFPRARARPPGAQRTVPVHGGSCNACCEGRRHVCCKRSRCADRCVLCEAGQPGYRGVLSGGPPPHRAGSRALAKWGRPARRCDRYGASPGGQSPSATLGRCRAVAPLRIASFRVLAPSEDSDVPHVAGTGTARPRTVLLLPPVLAPVAKVPGGLADLHKRPMPNDAADCPRTPRSPGHCPVCARVGSAARAVRISSGALRMIGELGGRAREALRQLFPAGLQVR